MLIRRRLSMPDGLSPWSRAVVLLSLLVAIVNGWNLIAAQTAKYDELVENARIWDETHQEIVALLDENRSVIDSREFLFPSFHINRLYPLQYNPQKLGWHKRLFYGLDYEPEFG